MRIDPVIVKERDTLGQITRGLDNGITVEENLAPEGTAGQVLTSNGLSLPPSYQAGVGQLVYGPSIAVDMKVCTRCKVIVTDNTAFRIENPTNPLAGPDLTFDILNVGATNTGPMRWGSLYSLSDGPFLIGDWPTLKANFRKTITFYYDGSRFIELSRSEPIVLIL